MTASKQPEVVEIKPILEPLQLLRKFQNTTMPLLLESAAKGRFGRYTFLTANPIKTYRLDNAQIGRDPFAEIKRDLVKWQCEKIPDLPPFQAGIAGLMGYELGHAWEKLDKPTYNEFPFPALTAGLYDWVIAWDHQQEKCWLIVQPEISNQPVQKQIDSLFEIINQKEIPNEQKQTASSITSLPKKGMLQFEIPNVPNVTSNFSKEDYLKGVERVLEYIHAGDIFQANLSQRLMAKQVDSPLELYARLRKKNGAPFAGYFADADWAVLSASPERYLQVIDSEIRTRPIKGTRKRTHRPEADLYRMDELKQSEKDRAENVMIVDLLRNDLSKVALPGSVKVPEVCIVESHETVQHLVSEVCAKLKPNCTPFDLFAGAFPGGSITGAPKIRAMEIITELEQTTRGPYCGSLFYHSFDGSVDSNLLIRTFLVKNGCVLCSVGGGIVAQSSPDAEYAETMHKAEGMLHALKP